MIGQPYSTAENGTGSLPERVHFQWLEGPLAPIVAMAGIVLDTTISIAAGRLSDGSSPGTDSAVTADLYRVANWLAKCLPIPSFKETVRPGEIGNRCART